MHCTWTYWVLMLWLTVPVGSMGLLMSTHFQVSKLLCNVEVILESPEDITNIVFGVTHCNTKQFYIS